MRGQILLVRRPFFDMADRKTSRYQHIDGRAEAAMLLDDTLRQPVRCAASLDGIAVEQPYALPIGISAPAGIARRHEDRMLDRKDETRTGNERPVDCGDKPLEIFDLVKSERTMREIE